MQAAAEIASVDGLDSVTIGRLAGELSMSKSGVIGQFGSKQSLQLSTVDYVLDIFRRRVWEPVREHDAGLPRLLATCRSWVDYAADPGFDGGCCLTQVTFDFDGRTGAVHDKLAGGLVRWRAILRLDVDAAIEAGDLSADLDPAQAVFGLEAIASGITPARMVHGDTDVATWALHNMHAILGLHPHHD